MFFLNMATIMRCSRRRCKGALKRMTEETTKEITEETLDTRGLICPLPVLKARKRLQSLASGSILRVLSDDAGSLTDFQHFCTEQSHKLLEQRTEEANLKSSPTAGAMVIVHRICKG